MEDNKALRTILICLLVYIASVVVALFGGIWIGHDLTENRQEQWRDTVIVTVTDTIPYYQPVEKDSLVVRYETRYLKQQGALVRGRDTIRDTVAVEIPIMQKQYETEDYRAYVSGYEPCLDSIFVNRRTVTETVTVVKQKDKRLGFSIVAGAGWGIINKKPDIFVGGAVAYRIW